MSSKRGLGKGLGALIPIDTKSEDLVQEINLNEIQPNRHQPRRRFDEEKIKELSASIEENGVLQPIILRRKSPQGYEIVAGERRWRAAVKAGLRKIPAIVRELSDAEVMAIALIENLQREDLNSIEEALAYKRLMSEFGLTQEDLSKRLGKSRSFIANTVRLLNLEKEIQDLIAEEKITAGHARALLAVENSVERLEMAKAICEENLSVRQVEEMARKRSQKRAVKQKKPQEINPVLVDITEKLQRFLGTRVRIKGTEKKGKIEIEFYSGDELERILEVLNL